MTLTSIPALYVGELKDLFSAENQLARALPQMAKAASAPQLRQAFTDQLHQTQVHINRLEGIIERLGVDPKGKNCKAMEILIAEAKYLTDEEAHPAVLDAALIAVAQRMEHIEMAEYGSLRIFARLLGYDQVADMLQTTLDEKHHRDKKLTALADTVIGGGVHADNGRRGTAIARPFSTTAIVVQ